MASAASAVPIQTPCIVFDSRAAGLISIVEEELLTEEVSPSESPSPLHQAPTWRKIDYFGDSKAWDVKGHGVKSATGTGCPLVPMSRTSSPEVPSSPASPNITIAGWGMVPSRHASPLGLQSPYSPIKSWTHGSQTLPQLSSVIPDISDDEASRQGSIAELEIFLRKASVVQSQTEKCNESKADVELLSTEESDVLGPLHSPLTPLTPSIRTSTSPRASSECLGRPSSSEDQSTSNATRPKLLHLNPSSVCKQINNFADLHSFSFGQSYKTRKESGAVPDPMSVEDDIQRPSSARLSLGSSVLHEITQDVMLINPITGERRMSAIRTASAGEQLARPSLLRRSSSATSMYTLVRRDSLLGSGLRTPSSASRPSLSARNSSIRSSKDFRLTAPAHSNCTRTSSSMNDRHIRPSLATRHMSSTSQARTTSTTRTMSHSSYARTMSSERTMSASTWSRTMSTFTRASSTTSMSVFDEESVQDESQHNQHNHNSCDGAQTQRKPSLLVPLFGHFQWNKKDSSVILPTQELEPAYQEALADVAEDPDFVEVEIEPKAGPITRRASLFANIFTNKDVDVDPDLKFKPSASETEIKQGIAEAQKERSQRKMLYSRNIAAVSLVIINAFCIILSFGIFSVWYATAPLILVAPLLKSTMALDLVVGYAYRKAKLLAKSQEEELETPIMDYATSISFSDESFEDIQSTLDSLADQKDVDLHKNLLLISCNDNIWNSDYTKSTTRIILENILTNIVDEAKFRMPSYSHDAGFQNMWCRRGTYKGLPYVLMIKEGSTMKTEFHDLIRKLLHAYNLRKESYHNPVPSAFFAWYKEWAELHDFASFDFLVNVNSETSLDEHCISQLYQQALKHPVCAAVSSRVEVDYRSFKWGFGNLFSNAQLMYDQIRQCHQTQIMHKASVSPSACQMLRICEETCGPQVLEETKKHRPFPMSNMVRQIRSFTEEDNMMYGAPQVTTLQAVHAVTYARSSITFSEFLLQRQRFAFSTCATNVAILCNIQMHWFERLSSAAELLAWCLPLYSLALIINFLRSAVLQQNIPVMIVLSAIVALPWICAATSAMWLAGSWEGRLRCLLGFCILAITGPLISVYVVVSTVFNLHRLRPELPRRGRSSAMAAHVKCPDV